MSDRITVRCPKCGAQLRLKNRKAVGKKVPCPKCERTFVVKLTDELDIHSDEFEEAEAAPKSDRKSRSNSSAQDAAGPAARPAQSKKSLLVFGGVMGAVLMAGLAWTAIQSVQPGAGASPATTSPGTGLSRQRSDRTDLDDVESQSSAQVAETAPAQPASPDLTTPPDAAATGGVSGSTGAANSTSGGSVVVTDELPQSTIPVQDLPPATIPVNQTEPAEVTKAAPEPKTSPVESEAESADVVAEVAAQPAVPVEHVGRQVPAFSAVAVDNTTYHSADRGEDVLVVAFMGIECPLASLYFPRMAELSRQFSDESVGFVAINSNAQDVLQDVQRQAQEFRLPFPVLKDASGEVAALFGATRTPEVFVLDRDRVVQYHGMFDDQYGYLHRRLEPTQPLVADAVTAVLAGESPAVQDHPIQGCHIGRSREPASSATTSFYRDVLPILQNRCQSCHREGNIGPFELADYEEVSNWAETIKEAVVERRMPPWKADPAHGEFVNDMSMPDEEVQTLVTWVDEGGPEGDPADSPPSPEWEEDWIIGKPDRILTMPKPEKVPATGVVPYKNVVVSNVFKEDTWVQAMECRMGNPSVVHHILALLEFPRDSSKNQDGLTKGFFAGAVPGNTHTTLRPGFAKLIPKGARIVFQLHYTPNGTATTDKSSLGLIYADEPEFVVDTYALGAADILVKAGDPDYKKTATLTIPNDVAISSMMPHLHLRGTSFQYRARFPGDKEDTTLLSIPNWDFNWQHEYKLVEPVMLKKGTKLTVEATWNNSESNPNNILPLVDVRFGEQTFDEMFIGYVNYIVPIDQFWQINGGSDRRKK